MCTVGTQITYIMAQLFQQEKSVISKFLKMIPNVPNIDMKD